MTGTRIKIDSRALAPIPTREVVLPIIASLTAEIVV